MKIFKQTLIGLFILFSWAPAHALNVAQITTEVRRALRDNPSDTSRQRYSDSYILDFLNEAQRDVVSITSLSEKATSYILAPLTTYYVLPLDLLNVNQVYFTNAQGQLIELDEFLQKSLYDAYPGWDRSNGSPVEYWVSPSSIAEPANPYPMRISYIPIPAKTSTGTITIWYFSQVADLVNQTDKPFDGRAHLRQYDMALAYHAIMRIKISEGKPDEAQVYQTLYSNLVGMEKNVLGRAPNYSPSMGIGGQKH